MSINAVKTIQKIKQSTKKKKKKKNPSKYAQN